MPLARGPAWPAWPVASVVLNILLCLTSCTGQVTPEVPVPSFTSLYTDQAPSGSDIVANSFLVYFGDLKNFDLAAAAAAAGHDSNNNAVQAAAQDRRTATQAKATKLISDLQSEGIRLARSRAFGYLWPGASLTAASDADAAQLVSFLRRYPGVSSVLPVGRVLPPPPLDPLPNPGPDGGVTPKLVGIDDYAPDDWTQLAAAKKKLKLDGSGVKAGIIDTGVDYTHPAIGGGPSGCSKVGDPGCRVVKGYDFVTEREDTVRPLAFRV